eukprot:1515101-Rhodomonas_salina.1
MAEENFLRPVEDVAGILQCFEQYGAVGVTGVFTPEECKALIRDGIDPFLPEGCMVDDPSTHHLADSGVFNRYGVIGKEPLFSRALLKARLHPRVVAAFQAVYGDIPLIACHDRAAWMRPAEDNPSFAVHSDYPGLHLDISPTSYFGNGTHRAATDKFLCGLDYSKLGDFTGENNCKHASQGRCAQAVLNLIDNAEEDGGFQFLPGAHGESLQAWVESQQRGNPNWSPPEPNGRYFFSRNKGDSMLISQHGGAVRLPSPAGTLIIFDAALPHGTKPNASNRSRLILFLRYMTPPHLPAQAWKQRNAALKRIAREVGFQPDERETQHLFVLTARRMTWHPQNGIIGSKSEVSLAFLVGACSALTPACGVCPRTPRQFQNQGTLAWHQLEMVRWRNNKSERSR